MLKMFDHVHNYKTFKVIDFEKPLYSYQDYDVVRVHDKYVRQASLDSQFIVIITPQGEKVFFPKQLKKEGKKVKEVFLRPDEPMVMYELEIQHTEKSPMERWQG